MTLLDRENTRPSRQDTSLERLVRGESITDIRLLSKGNQREKPSRTRSINQSINQSIRCWVLPPWEVDVNISFASVLVWLSRKVITFQSGAPHLVFSIIPLVPKLKPLHISVSVCLSVCQYQYPLEVDGHKSGLL